MSQWALRSVQWTLESVLCCPQLVRLVTAVELNLSKMDAGNSPGGSLTEETIGVGVTELTRNATHNRRAITEPTRETHQTGVGFTATIRVRTVVTLSVDTGTG